MKKKTNKALAVGAGVAAIGAAAAGAYMFTGKNAKNRKKVGKWVGNMQEEVLKELDKAGKVTKDTYHKAVDTATRSYKGLKDVNAAELALFATELKSSWDNISAGLNKASKTVKRVAPAVAKQVRSVPKKAPAKKAAPKKVAAKKAPAKKTPAKKAPAKKATA